MANQAIALQARAPQQGNFLAPAMQQGAQMINQMAQQKAAERQAAAQQQQLEIAQAKEGREVALQGPAMDKAKAEADAARLTYVMDFFKASALAIENSRDPQHAIAIGERMQALFPEPAFQQSIQETLASIPEDPALFEPWRQDSLVRTMDAAKQTERKLLTQKTGTEERILSIPAVGGGAATEVPGSRIQSAQDITYVRGPNGEVIAAPKTMPGTGGFGGGAAPGLVGGSRGSGVQFGQVVAGTGGGKRDATAVKPEKPLTQAQAKSTGYAMRAQEADKDLAAVKQFSPSAIASKRYAEDIPVLGALAGPLVNRALSENDQLAEQAQRNFINAVLRQDSGAAINAGEWANAQRQYFQQPNDKPAVIAQKARNRATAIEALKVGAGAGMKQTPSAALAKAPAGKRSTPTPAASGWGKAEVVGK